MFGRNTLFQYLKDGGLERVATFSDGSILNPGRFPVAGIETFGAVLFADLPGYSKLASTLDGVECAFLVSHFFTWFDEETKNLGGIVDKFIGDELMVVFPASESDSSPMESALIAARSILANDSYNFAPKIGIASGQIVVAIVGTANLMSVTALGEAVNLAARCVGKVGAPKTIRVATEDAGIIEKVFESETYYWQIEGPTTFKPKNMRTIKVFDITRKSEFIPQFDYVQDIKNGAKFARDHGAILSDDK